MEDVGEFLVDTWVFNAGLADGDVRANLEEEARLVLLSEYGEPNEGRNV